MASAPNIVITTYSSSIYQYTTLNRLGLLVSTGDLSLVPSLHSEEPVVGEFERDNIVRRRRSSTFFLRRFKAISAAIRFSSCRSSYVDTGSFMRSTEHAV